MIGKDSPSDSPKLSKLCRFTVDLEAIRVPALFLRGEDDQIVPIENSAHKAIKLVRDRTLKTYPGLSHGLFARHPELINVDLLAFIRAWARNTGYNRAP